MNIISKYQFLNQFRNSIDKMYKTNITMIPVTAALTILSFYSG